MSKIPTHTLASLPTDIHFYILRYIPNLSSLQSIILTHSTLHATYLTYRTQILKLVFLNQIYTNASSASDAKTQGSSQDSLAWKNACDIISKLPVSKDRPNQPSSQNLVIPKAISAHPDSEVFHATFWPTISKTLPSPVALRWGKELATCYANNNKLDEALKTAIQLWNSISKLLMLFKKAKESRSSNDGISIKRIQQECIDLLISIYRSLHLDDEAIHLQRQLLAYLSPQQSVHSSYSLSLCQTLQSLGEARLDELITFQKHTWELYSNVKGRASPFAIEWARHLLLTYNTNGLIQESLNFQMRVLNGLPRGSMEYISWSRGLINAYRKLQSSPNPSNTTTPTDPPALNINLTEAILQRSLLTFQFYPSTSPGYIGWSRDLCKILRSQNREDEALEIEIRVWEEMKRRRMAAPKDKGLAFRCRGPGLVVAASYRRLGLVEMAAAVERECGEGDKRFEVV